MDILKKTHLLAIGTALAMVTCTSISAETQHSNKEKSDTQETTQDANEIDMQKISEAFGNFIGRNLQSNGIEFNLEGIIKGMREGSAGKPAPLSEQEYEKMMTKLQEKAFNTLAETNLKAASDYLVKNATADGVIEVVPSKLQYIVLEEGKGLAIPEHGSPLINYTGKYIDGTVFGSSEDAGGPITVPLDQTIPGFSKGLLGMKEGEKRRLFVHPELGYGRSGHLAPNSLLIFEIEAVKATSPDKNYDDSGFNEDNADMDDDLDNLDDAEFNNPAENETK